MQLLNHFGPQGRASPTYLSLFRHGHRHSLISFEVDRDFAELQTMGGFSLKSYGSRKALYSLKGKPLMERQRPIPIYYRHSASLSYRQTSTAAHHHHLHHKLKGLQPRPLTTYLTLRLAIICRVSQELTQPRLIYSY